MDWWETKMARGKSCRSSLGEVMLPCLHSRPEKGGIGLGRRRGRPLSLTQYSTRIFLHRSLIRGTCLTQVAYLRVLQPRFLNSNSVHITVAVADAQPI